MKPARARWLLAMLLAVGCSGGPAAAPRMIPQPIEPAQLVPASMNIVARVDWDRADKARVREDVLAWMRTAQVSEHVLDSLQGCLPRAKELTVALRSSRSGFEGDVIVITRLRDQPSPPRPADVPCAAPGWRFSREARGMLLFEREAVRSERPEPALLVASTDQVAVVSQALVDSVVRILREGPDADRIDPLATSTIAVDARLTEGSLPDGLRGRSPVIADLARGLEHVRVQVDAADAVHVRSVLSYAASEDAKAAGAILSRLRAGLAD